MTITVLTSTQTPFFRENRSVEEWYVLVLLSWPPAFKVRKNINCNMILFTYSIHMVLHHCQPTGIPLSLDEHLGRGYQIGTGRPMSFHHDNKEHRHQDSPCSIRLNCTVYTHAVFLNTTVSCRCAMLNYISTRIMRPVQLLASHTDHSHCSTWCNWSLIYQFIRREGCSESPLTHLTSRTH